MHNRTQYNIVTQLLKDARQAGATLLTGGDPDPDALRRFYPLTLVADIDNGNPVITREQFEPALPIIRYEPIDEAVAMANGLDVGLGASVWSSDRDIEGLKAVAAPQIING